MAATLLTSGFSNAAGPYNVASATYEPTRLYLIGIASYSFSATVGSSAITGSPATEATAAGGQLFNSSTTRGQLFRYVPGSQVTQALEITNSNSGVGASWAVIELTDVKVTGTDGADGVVQAVLVSTTGDDPNSLTNTLAALTDATNNPVIAFWFAAGAAAWTPGGSYSELVDLSTASAGQTVTYLAPGTTTPSSTNATAFLDLAGIAVELDYEPAGGFAGPFTSRPSTKPSRQRRRPLARGMNMATDIRMWW